MILTPQIDLNCAIEESRKRLNEPFRQAELAALLETIRKVARNRKTIPGDQPSKN